MILALCQMLRTDGLRFTRFISKGTWTQLTLVLTADKSDGPFVVKPAREAGDGEALSSEGR